MTQIEEAEDDHDLPEEDLKALRSSDRVGTERFVRKHAGWMLAVARRILGDLHYAEDAVQSAFAQIFANLERFEGRSALKTWMHRVVVNEALQGLRRQHRAKTQSIDALLPLFDENGCRVQDDWMSHETPERLMEQAQTRSLVSESIDSLPDPYRIVLILRDIEELSTAEVAKMLELSEANVKVRLHRARAALKKLLEPVIGRQEP